MRVLYGVPWHYIGCEATGVCGLVLVLGLPVPLDGGELMTVLEQIRHCLEELGLNRVSELLGARLIPCKTTQVRIWISRGTCWRQNCLNAKAGSWRFRPSWHAFLTARLLTSFDFSFQAAFDVRSRSNFVQIPQRQRRADFCCQLGYHIDGD